MIPTRERCGLCHAISPVGFWVPDETWAAVVHPSHLHTIHCLRCFTDRADEKLIPWDRDIKFYPVSRATHLADVRGMPTLELNQVSNSADALLEDCDRLRQKIHKMAAALSVAREYADLNARLDVVAAIDDALSFVPPELPNVGVEPK